MIIKLCKKCTYRAWCPMSLAISPNLDAVLPIKSLARDWIHSYQVRDTGSKQVGGGGRCLRKCVSPEVGVNVGAAAMKLFLALRSAPFSLSISPRGLSASALIEPRCQVMLWLHSYLQLLECVTFLLDIFSLRPWSRKRAQDIFYRRDMWSSFAHDINLL